MSASYIHRDPLILNQAVSIQKLPVRMFDANPQTDYMSLSASNHHRHNRIYEELTVGDKSSPPTQSQPSMQSPKMSPDSTLTHVSVSRFQQNSSKMGGSSSTSPSTCESFLRSALLSECTDRSCVGSSTSDVGGHVLVTPTKYEPSRMESASPTCRTHTLTASTNVSPSSNEAHSTVPHSSTTIPSSTTPIKKSSRRNPWGSETYSDLITVAIHSYPDQQATLQQIYDFIITHYDYFRDRSDPATSAGWKNSIRHNLSLHDRFTKCPKSSDNTKSSYWRINTDVASKPYVRRRACSMDGSTILKRPSGKTGRGTVGGTRLARHNEKLLARTVALNPIPLPSLHEIQPYSSQMDCTTRIDSNFFEVGTGQSQNKDPAKLLSYFSYGSNVTGLETESSGDLCNGNLWPQPKAPLSSVRSNYPNSINATASGRPYAYDQLCSNVPFDVSDFHSAVGSTDHALVRSRANSLIEHLLRADNPSVHRTPDGRQATATQLSQPYLPNALFGHTPAPNRIVSMGSSAFLSPSHPVDMRHQSRSTATPESPADGSHLQPLYSQSNPGNPSLESASTFSAHWPNYSSQFPFSGSYPHFLDTQPFSSFRPADMKSGYDRLAGSSNTVDRMLSFSSNPPVLAPLSPSTNSSTSSSTRSWRPGLGIESLSDVQARQTSNNLATSTRSDHCSAVFDSHSLTPNTPPTSIYYSAMRSSLSNMFTAPTCALDTPPYQHVKPEPPEDQADESIITAVITNEGANGHCSLRFGNPIGNDGPLSIAYDHTGSEHSIHGTTRYANDYGFSVDVDRDKLELELSLELAERIVASTRPAEPK